MSQDFAPCYCKYTKNISYTGSIMFIQQLFANILEIDIVGEEGEILSISATDPFVGRTLYCKCMLNGSQVFASSWSILQGGQYVEINENGKLTIEQGVENQ